jgi:hypothetical protein
MIQALAMNFLLIFNVFVNRQKSLASFAFMEQMDALLQFKVLLNIAPKPYLYLHESCEGNDR